MKTNELSKFNDEIVDKYLNNSYTTKMLAEEYNCHTCSIQRLLKRNNINLRNSKYAFDENYFEFIDSEHKAYWLGFMYADGYVNSKINVISLRLKHDDDYILKEFIKDLKSNLSIRYYKDIHKTPSGNLTNSYYCSIVICSKKMKQDLINNGCYENKSLILKFPNTIPVNLIPHFIRGYFDGDGCVTKSSTQLNGNRNYKVSICGTKEFLNGIKDNFNYKNKLSKRYKDNTNNYSLDIGGNIKCLDFLETIYKNSTIHLNRKYDRYLELTKLVPNISNDVGNNTVNCGNTLRALRTKQSRKLRLWEE